MKRLLIMTLFVLALAACESETQFTAWRTEAFDRTAVTESSTRTFMLANPSTEEDQHLRAIAFDRGSNSAGHFRIESVEVGNQSVDETDVVLPPGGVLTVTVTYSPKNLETTKASYGGWVTGEEERWIPKHPDEAAKKSPDEDTAIHRAIIEAVYDYPKEGICFVQLVGEAEPGPKGEDESGGGSATCEAGNGVACYTGGFSIDIPQLSPGGPQTLELTGPVRMSLSDGVIKMLMDDFPYAIMYLSSEDTPQLPSGVTVTIIISGSEGVTAEGTFDGSRIAIDKASFRIRAAMGELTADDIRQGISALVDFDIPDLVFETTKPLTEGSITLHLETKLPNNPSGNELFDQFLSGADVIVIMEGEFKF